MFERFTERARQIEHLLLARENDGVAARILLDVGIEGEKIRDEVIRMLGLPRSARHRRARLSSVRGEVPSRCSPPAGCSSPARS